MDTYKLNGLGGMTVGNGADFDSFADVIDYLHTSNHSHMGLDAVIDQLDECPTDEDGNYDEDEAKEICMNVLDGEDIDDEDPETEWGDEMYCRQAGK